MKRGQEKEDRKFEEMESGEERKGRASSKYIYMSGVRALCEAIDDEVDAELDRRWSEAVILDQAANPPRAIACVAVAQRGRSSVACDRLRERSSNHARGARAVMFVLRSRYKLLILK